MERPARLFEAEAHHGLVDGTDVLHVQGAVGDVLAAEHEELFQHAVDGAVAHPRRRDAFAHAPGAANDVAAAFEKAVALRVEQGTVAGRQLHGAGVGAVVDHAEQGEQLGVGAVALIHRVRVLGGILGEALVQAGK